jgi:hypothetical protein
MKRRRFLLDSAKATAAAAFTGPLLPTSAFAIHHRRAVPAEQLFVGTPVLPEFLMERGIANVLDEARELSGVNTIMTFSHDHVFRQYRPGFGPKTDAEGHPLTNVWVKTNPEYYARPDLQGKDFTARYADRDILDELEAEARPRRMQVYARILEPYVITGAIPGAEDWREIDANGEATDHICFNHPEYIAYWSSVIADLILSHPYLAGFKFGQERGGPLLEALGSRPFTGKCFCPHCLKMANSRGLDAADARQGYRALDQFGKSLKAAEKPTDGAFVAFLRLLMHHPTLLAWEQFWMDAREAQRHRIYEQIKRLNEQVQVGWHIDHGMTWDLITRASWDYHKMGPYSDWLSVAVYFDSMGRRSRNHFRKNYQQALFADADEDTAYAMYLSMLGYDPKEQPALQEHEKADTAFHPQYVYDECARAVKAVKGQAKVHARPGFDMPGYDCQVQPEQVYKATRLAFDAGVDGLWVGREWDELTPKNAAACGNAVRDYLKSLK